jgi:hypothetical protein
MAFIAAATTGIVMSRMRVLDKVVAAVAGMLGFGGGAGQQADQPAPASGKEAGPTAGSPAAEEIRAPSTPNGNGIVRGR